MTESLPLAKSSSEINRILQHLNYDPSASEERYPWKIGRMCHKSSNRATAGASKSTTQGSPQAVHDFEDCFFSQATKESVYSPQLDVPEQEVEIDFHDDVSFEDEIYFVENDTKTAEMEVEDTQTNAKTLICSDDKGDKPIENALVKASDDEGQKPNETALVLASNVLEDKHNDLYLTEFLEEHYLLPKHLPEGSGPTLREFLEDHYLVPARPKPQRASDTTKVPTHVKVKEESKLVEEKKDEDTQDEIKTGEVKSTKEYFVPDYVTGMVKDFDIKDLMMNNLDFQFHGFEFKFHGFELNINGLDCVSYGAQGQLNPFEMRLQSEEEEEEEDQPKRRFQALRPLVAPKKSIADKEGEPSFDVRKKSVLDRFEKEEEVKEEKPAKKVGRLRAFRRRVVNRFKYGLMRRCKQTASMYSSSGVIQTPEVKKIETKPEVKKIETEKLEEEEMSQLSAPDSVCDEEDEISDCETIASEEGIEISEEEGVVNGDRYGYF